MSNKIALATIQFRADAKGANVALDSLRASAADARKTVNEMQAALDRGIKTMKDANGVDFDVEAKLKAAKKEANNFEQALRELMKGATALESVVKNIRLGEIEKSSRAELKGAINAAESRKRSVRGDDEESLKMQRELNIVIEESRKQLNNLDRDTQKVIETLKNGGVVAESVLEKEQKGLKEILSLIPKGTDEYEQYAAQLKEIQTYVANIRQQEQTQATALLGEKNLGKYSEEQIRAAISSARELIQTYKTASPEAKALADNIVRAEQHLKEYGVEAARAAAKETAAIKTQEEAERQLQATMNRRLRNLSTISTDALAEAKKYWEAQKNGAEQGTDAFNKAAAALKKIEGQERSRKVAGLNEILGDPSRYGVAEVRNAVQEMEKLRDSVMKGTPYWHKYNNALKQGKEYLDQLAKTEAADKISAKMQNLTTLSAAGLQEVKKYWETMISGAERGSTELDQYKAKLEEVIREEQVRSRIDDRKTSAILSGGNLGAYSENEIKAAIEAGNRLVKTYQTGSTEAAALAQQIVAAEEHLKQYGVEAERAAQREARQVEEANRKRQEAIDLMVKQFNESRNTMSDSALKANERFWQQLIDDPKTAAAELENYQKNLKIVQHYIQQRAEQKIQTEGQSALSFFRGDTGNASATQIKQQADALKKYRDSLPQQTQADLINEINSYLVKTGQTADAVTEDMLDLTKAMGLSANAGKSAFGVSQKDMERLEGPDGLKERKKYYEEMLEISAKGSEGYKMLKRDIGDVKAEMDKLPFSGATEDLKKAQQAIEKAMASADKGTPKYERLRNALARIKAEMSGAGISAQKTQEVLANPRAEKNIDTLKNAVARARAEMEIMGQRSERLKRLIEQASGSDVSKHRLGALQKELKQTESDMEQLAKSTKEADAAQKALANTTKGTASSFDKAWSRLKTYITLYMGAAVAIQKLTATMGDLMDLSDKMGEVRKTTGFSADEVGRLSENLKKLDTRTSITGLLDLSVAAGQLGLKTEEDVQGFTEAANKLMVALPEMGKEGATEMLKVALATGEIDKIRKQMEQGLIEGSSATAVAMEKVGSTIDRLRATSAATAPAITDFVKRVGAVGAQSGISIDQVAALGSTVDALGMRVEMSATALSRMIPAIKNNAFDVAKAIGVTPDTLRNLFETGKGMEAILMIFQRIKDAGMDEDSVEKMLGMGNMKEIMKELNQQGARAGIVFAGLSQNVDTLREHLRTAANAYQENIAIQQEYDKMNETTAAKWERLKNQIEEMFIGDRAQRFLGGIIDGLRKIVSLVESLHRSILVLTVVFGTYRLGLGEALKSLWTYMTNIGNSVKDLKKWFSELNKANVWGAVIAGAMAAAYAIYDWIDSMREAAREAAKFEAELIKEQMKVDNLATSIGKARAKMEDANDEVNKAQKAFDAAKKSLDGTRESTEKLTKAETELIEKQEMQRNAMAEHKRLIESFNTEYSKYLGFMLSEIASDMELAQARELVNDKLRETITLKRKEAALTRVENSLGEERDESYASLWDAIQGGAKTKDKNGKQVSDPTKAARVINTITKAAQKGFKTLDEYKKYVQKTLEDNNMMYEDLMHKAVLYYKDVDKIRKANQKIEDQWKGEESANREQSQADLKRQYDSAVGNYAKLATIYTKSTGDARKKAAADLLKQMDSINEMVDNAGSYYRMEDAKEKKDYSTFMKNADTRVKGMKEQREQLLKEAGDAYKPRGTVGGGKTTSTNANPWGSPQPGESTNYKDMNAEVLVNRRKQMKDFVNAIQTDSDVQAVLAEDKALKKAIENGMSSDMRTVIEWYNTERLKIQDELHARHLTNTGDWMDPKQQKARKKRLQDDMKAFLEELDAYYTERKTRIQEAGNEEGVTEAEVRNRTLANEMEWRQRRAELQLMYSRRATEITKDEQDAIAEIIAERTGDDMKFIKATIAQTVKFSEAIRDANEQGAKEYRKFQGDLDLGSQKDWNKVQMTLYQQLKAIQDIIDKERPFNGITKNLRENLVTMGILTADMSKERDKLMKENADMTDFNARQAAEEVKRTAFMLGEAENAYSTTIEDVMRRMADAGMDAWADELRQNPKMQEGLMAQLRQSYDAIQEAIKKEASQLKKQAEIMWNNILMPDGKTTLKDATDRAIAQLGIEQGRVSRANSLIGAGAQSERVADKLAIKQMQIQLTMQEHYYNLMKKRGQAAVDMLNAQAKAAKERGDTEEATRKELDAQHAAMALNLATAKEETELAKQREDIIARTEESQNRLYTQLREWGDLLASSMKDIFEASHAGDAEYYNERAKMQLTGKGGPGAGTYIVIDNEGTEDARAHYEYLDERAALERQHEIEQQNAQAEAWRKVMDNLNAKMNEQITDWINASLQNAAVEENTREIRNLEQKIESEKVKLEENTKATHENKEATIQSKEANTKAASDNVGALASNTEAVIGLTQAILGKSDFEDAYKPGGNGKTINGGNMGEDENGVPNALKQPEAPAEQTGYGMPWQQTQTQAEQPAEGQFVSPLMPAESVPDYANSPWAKYAENRALATEEMLDSQKKELQGQKQTDQQLAKSAQSTFAKMTAAANMYGIAFQTMSNENLSTAQKVEMMIVQAAGQALISMLTAQLAASQGQTAAESPSWISKTLSQLGPIAGPVAVGVFTALIGGLMGVAVSKISKSKSQIAQVTGSSASAGRLATGMLTYASGNVNELSDPDSLTVGRSYNVDGADGNTYRAKYMGKNAKTHITNGPEFHLVGEKGQEAIIDAHTTKLIRMNDTGIWHDIQTLYNGGSLSAVTRRRRGRGVRTFADGNIDDFEEAGSAVGEGVTDSGFSPEMAAQMQASLDRNSDVMERVLQQGIHAYFDVYGKGGLVDSYDTGKKTVSRHGERY